MTIEFKNGSKITPLTSSKCKRSKRIQEMFPSFPNYTEETYEGDEPQGSLILGNIQILNNVILEVLLTSWSQTKLKRF